MTVRKVIAVIVAAAMLVTDPVWATVNGHFNDMFDALLPNTNVTTPGAYMSARRGVVSGGDIEMRTPIMDINVLTVTPPSFQAGCNGISLHGGALSFINGEEFQNLLRQIASNSVGLLSGYVFDMALKAMCEDCATTINDLSKKINDIAHSLKNSCEAAKRLTASAPGYMQGWADDIRNSFAVESANDGTTSDPNAGLFSSITDLFSNMSDALKAEVYGNVTWKVMSSGFDSWFANALDQEAKELLLSLVGTIVTTKPDDGKSEIQIDPFPAKIEVVDLLNGGSLSVYSCDDATDCAAPVATTSDTIRGFKDRVQEILLGRADQSESEPSTIGIIAKLRSTDKKDVFTDTEVKFIGAMRPQIMGLLADNANKRSVFTAIQANVVDVVAAEMTVSYVNQLCTGLSAAIAGRKDKGIEVIQGRIKELREQFPELRRQASQGLNQIAQAIQVDADVKRKIKRADGEESPFISDK